MAHGIEQKLEEVVTGAAHQLQVWEEARVKVLSQLASISNLVEQLATLQRCIQSQQLGVLASYPECVARLEAKITQSAERALGYVERDKTRMADAVRCLKDLSRECQKLFEDAVGGPALAGDCINALAMFNSRTGLRGMEAISRNTADSFALSNYPYWLKELHCAYDLDTSGKLSALEQLRYSGAGVQVVCEQWRVQPGPQDILQDLCYTARTRQSCASDVM